MNLNFFVTASKLLKSSQIKDARTRHSQHVHGSDDESCGLFSIHGKEQEWKNGGYVQQRSSSCGRLKSFHVHNHVQEQREPKTLYSEQTNREAKQANC